MKRWLKTPLNQQRLTWGIGMGLGAMVAMLLVVGWLNSLSVLPGEPLLVRPAVLEALGWPAAALLALELLLAFGFGVSIGLAVPPMEGTGTAVAVRTVVHLLVSSALFAGICWVCGLPPENWQGLALLLGLYYLMYLTVWLLRYLHWRRELEDIRRELGLSAPAPAGGPLQVRPVMPYLLLTAAMELMVPPLLRLLERGSDIPVLTGLFYPYLLLPFLCLAVGWAAGRRLGLALVLPAACAAMTVPHVFLLYNESALFQTGVAAVFALVGNLAGAIRRRLREGARCEEQ